MRQLIYPVDWDIDENWPHSGKKYKYNCVDKATLDLIDSQNEVYLIFWWYNRRNTDFYDVAKGTFYRGEYGVVNFSGNIVKSSRNYRKYVRSQKWDSVWLNGDWLPAADWREFHEFLGIEMTDENKLTALVFDNEQEALNCLNEWYEFMEKKNKESNEKFFSDENTKKTFNERLNSIKNVINSIDEAKIKEYWGFIDKIYWDHPEFRK